MWDGTHAIGIDLGTTYSSVAVLEGDSVAIIPNEKMNRTSSCVAFTDTGRLMGNEAKNRVLLNPENTIFGSKRMIGRKFDDPKIQQDMENWQFEVVNECGMPKIRPQVQGETKTFAPEEISAMVLREMRKTAERYLVEKVMHAVISVPACFNDSQRQATINAAKISGLKFIWLITEPAAAALACMVGEQLEGTKNVLIFDLGGGTLDVSVIEVEGDRECKVKSTAGDNHLGGEDFDSVLVAHFVEEFKTKHQKDLRTCPKALQRLRIECEYAKRILSSCSEVSIYINCLFDGINFHSKLTRLQFEDMCMNLFLSIIKPVKRALFDAEMAKGSIDEVVLVGGSTRIPMIREMLKEFFDGKEPFVPIVPFAPYVPYEKYEAVAFGAAVCASVLRGLASSDQFDSYQVIDVAPFSLLLETREGVMTTLIHRNSQIPCEMSKVFSTDVDNQSSIDIDVYEGERAVAEDNRLLGRFCIEGIPQVAKGVPQVEVKFQLDSNGILDVSAESSETQSISVIADKGGFSVHEIDKMMQKARRWIFEDYHERKRNNAREELISYAYSVKLMVEYSSDDSLTEGDRDRALEICDYFLDWMEENPLEELIVIEDLTDSAKVQLSPYIATMDRERYR